MGFPGEYGVSRGICEYTLMGIEPVALQCPRVRRLTRLRLCPGCPRWGLRVGSISRLPGKKHISQSMCKSTCSSTSTSL